MIIAFLKDFFRFYLIAILAGLAWPLAEFLVDKVGSPLDGIIAFSSIGTIILIVGIYNLKKFLVEYPVHSVELDFDEN